MSAARQPAAPAPGISPENSRIIQFEEFSGGLNTLVPRPAIKDNQLAISDGFMPIGNILVTLPGTATPIYTAATGRTIIYFQWFNIGGQPYCFILLDNGAIDQVTPGGAVTHIAPAATVAAPSTFIGAAQWASQYFIWAVDQTNGYWIWDGSHLFTAGTIGPAIIVTEGGAGYTTIPTVTIYGGSGAGATATAVLENESVSQVNITAPGSGYLQTDTAIVLFSGGNGTRTAHGTASLSNGVIVNAVLLSGGINYQSLPTIAITDPHGAGAQIVVSSWATTGSSGSTPLFSLTGLRVVAGGSGYTNPTITFSGGSASTQATAYLTTQNGVITGLTTVDAGVGYVGDVGIAFIAPTGTGATAQVYLDSTGAVSQVLIEPNGATGSGYSGTVFWVVTGAGPAAASLSLMPFGISGTAIETFGQRVWLGNGAASAFQNRLLFSAPGDPADFSPAVGAGATPSLDSFLRIGYFSLRQTNGFLYLIGDSSINYVSGVQTSTQQPQLGAAQTISTFNNQNADPQIGSPWQGSVQVFSRNIVLANPTGVYVSYGGAATRISATLDGIYGSHTSGSGATQKNFSSAVATLSIPGVFDVGIAVYMLLLPIVDQVSGSTVNKLLIWDGQKWFTSQQDRTLTWIGTKEFESEISAWGTDGTILFRMFDSPTTGFTKYVRGKLYSGSGYHVTKTALRLHALIQDANSGDTVTISIDNETAIGAGAATQAITTTAGLAVLGPYPVAQNGRLLGFSITTTAAELTIMSVIASGQDYTDNL